MPWKETGILQQLSFLIREIHSIEHKLNLARQQFTDARIEVLTYLQQYSAVARGGPGGGGRAPPVFLT